MCLNEASIASKRISRQTVLSRVSIGLWVIPLDYIFFSTIFHTLWASNKRRRIGLKINAACVFRKNTTVEKKRHSMASPSLLKFTVWFYMLFKVKGSKINLQIFSTCFLVTLVLIVFLSCNLIFEKRDTYVTPDVPPP